MTVPDRAVPPELLDLARLALVTGLDEVQLGFEGLGAHFPAPIGWILGMTRVDDIHIAVIESQGLSDTAALTRVPNHLRVTAQVGTSAVAFRGIGEPYWDADNIAEWIRRSRPGIDSPAETERAAFQDDAALMLGAWQRGWTAERALRRGSQTGAAHSPYRIAVPMVVSYRFSALNYFYNVEGHIGHRDHGAPVSVDVLLSRASIGGDWIYSAIGLDRIPVERALATVDQAPPWHAEVAYFDDDLEDWVI
ncbi:hypothetical protein ACIQUM_07485 [Amycolatopsis azurea]|uniref:hypothetical protein n=1 Tax=Amycolatopsis azurea TaxID=36819 RepID=UPI00382E069D